MGGLNVELRRRHKLSVEVYHRLGTSGILSDADHVELIEGEIIDMSPIGSRHAGMVNKLAHLLRDQVGSSAIVSVRNPLAVSAESEPVLDLAILVPRADFYARSHPKPQDVLLLIEVADTSLRYDSEVKIPLYAEAGITEVWLVNLESRSLIVHRAPRNGGYQHVEVLTGAAMAVTMLDGMAVSIAVNALFAPNG